MLVVEAVNSPHRFPCSRYPKFVHSLAIIRDVQPANASPDPGKIFATPINSDCNLGRLM
jgi:hypothetical protein